MLAGKNQIQIMPRPCRVAVHLRLPVRVPVDLPGLGFTVSALAAGANNANRLAATMRIFEHDAHLPNVGGCTVVR